MCGRYTLYSEKEDREIKRIVDEVNKKFNTQIKKGAILPTDLAPIICRDQSDKDSCILDLMNWGYDNPFKKGLIINARSETVMEKQLFRQDFITRRCLVPAAGFYESDSQKNQHLFSTEQILYLAGIYKSFNEVNKFVILTKSPTTVVAEVHNRMPVIIPQNMKSSWLNDLSIATELIKQDSVSLIEKACDNTQLRFPLDL